MILLTDNKWCHFFKLITLDIFRRKDGQFVCMLLSVYCWGASVHYLLFQVFQDYMLSSGNGHRTGAWWTSKRDFVIQKANSFQMFSLLFSFDRSGCIYKLEWIKMSTFFRVKFAIAVLIPGVTKWKHVHVDITPWDHELYFSDSKQKSTAIAMKASFACEMFCNKTKN